MHASTTFSFDAPLFMSVTTFASPLVSSSFHFSIWIANVWTLVLQKEIPAPVTPSPSPETHDLQPPTYKRSASFVTFTELCGELLYIYFIWQKV